MKPQIALLLLYSLLFVEGGFEERKKFHDWLCQKSPSLQSCSKPFTMSTYRKELATFRRNKELMFQKASTNGRIEDDSIEESDDDYEFYLWKKYLYRKYRKLLRKLKEERSEEETLRAITTGQQRYNSVRNSQYYTYPSYYRQPRYRPASAGSFPSFGGGGLSGLSNLFSFGISNGVGVGTPIGNFGVSSGFGLGIG
ncbi:hypothetical protein COOONC_09211 [Cooperia oncophora]